MRCLSYSETLISPKRLYSKCFALAPEYVEGASQREAGYLLQAKDHLVLRTMSVVHQMDDLMGREREKSFVGLTTKMRFFSPHGIVH